MSKSEKEQMQVKKPTPKKEKLPTKKQMVRQMKMLYDMLMETRQVVMTMTQRHEESKLRSVAEWKTVVDFFVQECGLLEEDINTRLGEHFTATVEEYNKIVQERYEQMQKEAEEQAEKTSEEVEKYLKEQGIDIPELEFTPEEEKLLEEMQEVVKQEAEDASSD